MTDLWPLIAYFTLILSCSRTQELSGETNDLAEPNFSGPIQNVTVALGREAVLTCSVTELGPYKVGWLKAEDQTILSLHTRVVTHNARVSVTHDNQRTWRLHIRQLKESDRGCYMCQINTNVMKKQIGCVDVHVPPDIVDSGTSSDVTVSEGENTTLVCRARGRPQPRIIWRREDSHPIKNGRSQARSTDRPETHIGESLTLVKVDRTNMGAYLCIASNDVPPAVSKRITLNVNFAPVIKVPNQLLGSPVGSDVTMACVVEAYPNTINYWLKNRGQMLLNGAKHIVEEMRDNYRVVLKLTVKKFNLSDLGTYTCVATNGLGKSEGAIRLYEIKIPTTTPTTTTTTTEQPTTTEEEPTTAEFTTIIYTESTTMEPVYREDFLNNNEVDTSSSVKSGGRKSRRRQQYSLSSSSAATSTATGFWLIKTKSYSSAYSIIIVYSLVLAVITVLNSLIS